MEQLCCHLLVFVCVSFLTVLNTFSIWIFEFCVYPYVDHYCVPKLVIWMYLYVNWTTVVDFRLIGRGIVQQQWRRLTNGCDTSNININNHHGICAICLNKIVLQEIAFLKGCEHAYWFVWIYIYLLVLFARFILKFYAKVLCLCCPLYVEGCGRLLCIKTTWCGAKIEWVIHHITFTLVFGEAWECLATSYLRSVWFDDLELVFWLPLKAQLSLWNYMELQ